VDDLTQRAPGRVFGLVRPNGAGRRAPSSSNNPDGATYGEVILDRVDVFEDFYRSGAEDDWLHARPCAVPSDLKVAEFLEFHAAAYGMIVPNAGTGECLAESGADRRTEQVVQELSRRRAAGEYWRRRCFTVRVLC
jgi:ABC-type multidrug transport system ATPase subunit